MHSFLFIFAAQSHLNAVTRANLSEQRPMQKLIANKIEKDDVTALGYLWCAYHLAKRELPKDEFSHTVDLLEMSGREFKRDAGLHYCSGQSITEFQSALADVVLDQKLSEIAKSQLYSLMIDESNDKANRKRMLIYAQYLSGSDIECALLSNVEITEGTADAETLVGKVLEELKCKGLDLKNLVGLGTDGASVMTGKRNGVVKRLKDVCPSLVGVHCAAHRCALASSQAAKKIPELDSYQRTVSNIFWYFTNSSLRCNKLREVQKLLSVPELKYAEVHSVRWLSMEKAVSVLYRTYPALCATLSHQAANGDCSAKGLYTDIIQYKFIAITHLMMDILPYLARLSKVFQNVNIDFSKVKPMVDSTCESLNDLIECEGVFVDKLSSAVTEENGTVLYKSQVSDSSAASVKQSIQSNVEFEGFSDDDDDEAETGQDEVCVNEVELNYYSQQKNMLSSISERYINQIVNNLRDRFQDVGLINDMRVIVPSNIESVSKVAKFGESEIKSLATHFSAQHDINIDDCVSEYKLYKRLVCGSYAQSSLGVMVQTVGAKYQDTMPNLLVVLKSCLLVPMTSVQCERGFSTQNRIKSKFRTRLNNKSLNDLMRISEDGPHIKDFDFQTALKKWKAEKLRKLYQK